MNEDERITRLRARFSRESSAPGVLLGVGDDAALLAAPVGEALAWTIDAHVEDVHFRRAWLSMRELGWKSFMAAASDLAAMGARPLGAVSALTLPADVTDDDLDALAEGQADAARAIGTSVVGGNLSRGSFTITTSLLGAVAKPLRRDAARAGDLLLVSGTPGRAAAGLALISRNHAASASPPTPAIDASTAVPAMRADIAACIDAWKKPRARIDGGRALAGIANAAMDVSDGLALDLHRMCEASGVGVEIDEAALVACAGAELASAAELLGEAALDLALFGGEDYALIAASPHEVAGFTAIGRFRAAPEVARKSAAGIAAVPRRGFSHF